jgi:hypothetical protein
MVKLVKKKNNVKNRVFLERPRPKSWIVVHSWIARTGVAGNCSRKFFIEQFRIII